MIKTIAMLREEYKDYVNPTEKIRRLVQQGDLLLSFAFRKWILISNGFAEKVIHAL